MSNRLMIVEINKHPQSHEAEQGETTDNSRPFWVSANRRGTTQPVVWRFKSQVAASHFMHTVLLASSKWRGAFNWIALEVVTFNKHEVESEDTPAYERKRTSSLINFWSAYSYGR